MFLVEEMACIDPKLCRSVTVQETIRKAIVARNSDREGGGGWESAGWRERKCSREHAYRRWGQGYRQKPNYVGAL